jgi:hypothetical protein
MIFLWQQRSRIPTTAEWDALYEAAPILDDEGQEMRAVCEHYMLHRNELERSSHFPPLFFTPLLRLVQSVLSIQERDLHLGVTL